MEGYGYALFVRHATKSNKTPGDERLEILMKDFSDVFSKDLPQGLPPLRGLNML